MSRQQRSLSAADKEEAFRIATKGLVRWYAEDIKSGMSDEALEAALEKVLGVFGGSCGPGRLDVVFQGSGLRIWAGWHTVNHVAEEPVLAGKQTVAMARHVYGIANPGDSQLSLF